MDTPFLSAAYARHLSALASAYELALADTQLDGIVIHSGSQQKRSAFDDQFWPLRPVPHFQHWLPLFEPECLLWIRPGKKPVLFRTLQDNFWEKPAPATFDYFWNHFDVRRVTDDGVRNELAGGEWALLTDASSRAASWGLSRACPEPLLTKLDAIRTRKTEYEGMCIAEANRIAARGHERVRALFATGNVSEFELHLAYLLETGHDEPETPYKNIVALGENGATLHHIAYGRTKSRASSLLLDAGAAFQGYASDITRTWVREDGAASATFRALVDGVEALQQSLCRSVALGKNYEALHEESHLLVGALLSALGIVRGSAEEADDKGLTRAFYPHGLGHSLGLQCHDVGCAVVQPKPKNPFLRNTSPVEAGQAFTIEPGVYFIPGLLDPLRQGPLAANVDWKLVDALTPFGGVRIEDDVLVLASGQISNLTREVLPKGGGRVS